LALTGVSWNFGSQADAQPDRGSFYQEAGVVAHQALQSSDDPVRVPLLELVAWGINALPPREPQPAETSDGDIAATTDDGICAVLDRSAADYELPLDYFTRLIWQESRFDPRSVSHAGAKGIAQFMPETARLRGLADPFDPNQALPKSAELLRDLRAQFGNIGLAAAAYNAGPQRIADWLAGRKPLPRETQAYVRIITGRPVDDWAAPERIDGEDARAALAPCGQLAALSRAEQAQHRMTTFRHGAHASVAARHAQQHHAKVQSLAQRKTNAAKAAPVPSRHGSRAAVAARPAQQRHAARAKAPAHIVAHPAVAHPAAAPARTHRRTGPTHVAHAG